MQKYLILILLILFISCANQPKNKKLRYTEKQISSLKLDSTKILIAETDSIVKIDLNPSLKKQHFDFGSLVKEIKLIPLETTNKSLLDAIRKIVTTDSYIYIYDDLMNGGIVIFDKEGKFIRRIPNGKGPGELVRLYDIDFDNVKNELIAYQHSFLLFFTPTGKFIRQERLPFGFYNFAVMPNGYIFKTLERQGNGHLGYLDDFRLLVTDRDFKLKSVGLYSSPSHINLEERQYLIRNNNLINVTQRFSDTIYQFISAANQLKARYVMDYSKTKLPEHYLHSSEDEFFNVTSKNDYNYFLGRYIDTKTHHVFFFENSVDGRAVIYRDKKSGNITGGTNADFNINEIPPIAFPGSASGNYFISWYYPGKNSLFSSNSSIISNEDKLKTIGLTENDNPVLVFFKLKDF